MLYVIGDVLSKMGMLCDRRKTAAESQKLSAGWNTKKARTAAKAESAQAAAPVKAEDGQSAVAASAVVELLGPSRACHNIEEWLQPKCNNFQAMHVSRKPFWGDIQDQIDAMAERSALGPQQSVGAKVRVPKGKDGQAKFEKNLAAKAEAMIKTATEAGLPLAVAKVVEGDCINMGRIAAEMLDTPSIELKLELMGEYVCPRWHQDQYSARALVSYNMVATEFLEDANVDFWELKNCGNNTCVVRDPSKVFCVEPGDLFFMKGATYPGLAEGLVHKSPEKRFKADGKLMHRLLLKVDIP